MPIGKQ